MDIINEVYESHKRNLIWLNKQAGEDPPENEIFHYTNISSIRSILESGKLRFTDARYLNDPKEIIFALNLLQDEASKLIAENKDNKEFVTLLIWIKYYFEFIISFEANYAEINERYQKEILTFGIKDELKNLSTLKSRIFLFCLSEQKDHLRQWMPYGDDGKGFSLGFYDQNHREDPVELNFVKVCYEKEDRKREFIRKFLSDLKLLWPVAIKNSMPMEFLQKVADFIWVDIVACKDSSYEDEKEWRIFYLYHFNEKGPLLKGQPKIIYHEKNNFLKPCIEIDMPVKMVSSLTFGPKTERILNGDSLTHLMRGVGATNFKFLFSEIPYK